MARPLTTQVFESTSLRPCNFLSQKVDGRTARRLGGQPTLYSFNGERKYQNRAERNRVLAALENLDESRCLFGLVIAWTGARVSEVLALTPSSFQIESGIVTFETLKRRVFSVREVRVPPHIMQRIERFFGLRKLQERDGSTARLWTFCRQTAWRMIKQVCAQVGVVGRRASPRGLRHGFGVETLSCGVPLPLIQRWMGHARMSTTSIYLSVSGAEELTYARRFWRGVKAGQVIAQAGLSQAA